MSEPHRGRRKAIGDVRLNGFVITYVTASSSNQRRSLNSRANRHIYFAGNDSKHLNKKK